MNQEAKIKNQGTATVSASRQVSVVNSQVGVIGDYAQVGDIHFHIEPPSNPRERRNRAAMLQLVRNTWIKGVLEQSLHGAALIELGMAYNPEAVDHPWDMVVQMPERPDKTVPPGTRIVDVFDELGGSLLILGEPGSGKTTMLLELARDLIARAEKDETLHIPVVFNLSSWAVKQQPLEDWLIEELRTKYYIPNKIAQAWIQEDTLLLLLDGLDEVKADARDKCVVAINAFRQRHLVPLVVCSRTADYVKLTGQLHLQHAITLQPLTTKQINTYLAGTGIEFQIIRAALYSDSTLRELIRSPLMLNFMILIYHQFPSANIHLPSATKFINQHLLNLYIQHMLQYRNQKHIYKRKQVICWLNWLAEKMSNHAKSIFFIEDLQPNWLPAPDQEKTELLDVLVELSLYGLFSGILGGVFFHLWSGNLFASLFVGFGCALFGAIFIGTFFGSGDNIELPETFKWSWTEIFPGLLLSGLLGGALVVINGLFGASSLIDALVAALMICMYMTISWIVTSIAMSKTHGGQGAISQVKIETKTIPGQGVKRSLLNTFLFVVFLPLAIGIPAVMGFGLVIGLVTGLVTGLGIDIALMGGGDVIYYFILRWYLVYTNRAPWNYTRFLDYCVDRVFLRRVGGGYVFIHRLLMEHFASLTPEDIERLAANAEGGHV